MKIATSASLTPFSVVTLAILFAAAARGQIHVDVDVLGGGSEGTHGEPRIAIGGSPIVGNPFVLGVRNALPDSIAVVGVSLASVSVPLPSFSATIHLAEPYFVLAILPIDALGESPNFVSTPSVPAAAAGITLYTQGVVADPGALGGLAFTPGLALTLGVLDSPHLFPTVAIGGFEAVAVGDLDGDGFDDLVGLDDDGRGPFVALATGDGGFAAPVDWSWPRKPKKLLVVDLDGDGWLDIVGIHSSLPQPSDTIHINYGLGDGTSEPVVVIGPPGFAFDIAVGDVHGDGRPDIVVCRLNHLELMPALPGRVFGPSSTFGLPFPHGRVEILDVNGDGIGDAVAPYGLNNDLRLATFYGNATEPFTTYDVPQISARVDGLVQADFDGDGRTDLAYSSRGTDPVTSDPIPTPIFLLMAQPGGGFVETATSLTAIRAVLAPADLDGDGNLELIVAASDHSFPTFERSNYHVIDVTGGTVTVEALAVPAPAPTFVVADVDGDAASDIVANCTVFSVPFNQQGRKFAAIQRSDGGAFEFGTEIPLPPVSHASHAADFDGDGRLDVLAMTELGSLVTLLGRGDGTFDEVVGSPTYPPQWKDRHFIGHINGDDILDVVVLSESSPTTVFVLLGQGDGTFVQVASWTYPSSSYTFEFAIADLDGDGHADLASANTSPWLEIRYGFGDGQFAPAVTLPLPAFAGDSSRRIIAKDVTGNGFVDLLVPTTTETLLFEALGGGNFEPAVALSLTEPARVLFAADVDLDGHIDLVQGLNDGRTVTIALGLGGGLFAPEITRHIGVNVVAFHVVDMNGDSVPDIVATTGGGFVAVIPGDGAGGFGEPFAYTIDFVGGLCVIGDFDGDSAIDVFASGGSRTTSRFMSSSLFR